MYKWDELEKKCLNCRNCNLYQTRTKVVFGRGNQNADIMFIGEAPGYYEDQQGLPFVGPAGQLLDKMLAAIGLDREKVYIANIIKCRPPNNRDPHPEEQKACINYLRNQYLLIQPKIIVCLGRISAKMIIATDFKITKQRGIWYERKGCQMIATFHPAALLRDEGKKAPAWSDFKSIKEKYSELVKS